MISGKDVYNVLSAVVPLYVAMILAYGSVRWWRILSAAQCGGINRFVAVFAVPLLSFQVIAKNDPYNMNFRFIAADSVSKVAILVLLGLWARYSKRGSLDWMITLFQLATLPNTLVIGIPLLQAMYGSDARALVVQAVVLQCVIWYTLMIFFYEFRAARALIRDQFPQTGPSIASFKVDSDVLSLDGKEKDAVQAEAVTGDDGKLHVQVRKSISSSQGLGLDNLEVHSSRRSRGLISVPSAKALTRRAPSLTGAEMYSYHSSVNLTPWESNFNPTDFYSMISGTGGSARQSNFTSSDMYSLYSSPRSSSFNEEHVKDVHAYSRGASSLARFPPPLYLASGHAFGPGHAGGMDGGVPRGGPYPDQSNPGSNTSVYSPAPNSQVSKKAVETKLSQKVSPKESPTASPKREDEAVQELHMFVWSSSTSLISEASAQESANNERAEDETARNEVPKAMEVRVLVVPPQSENNAKLNSVGDKGGPEGTRETYDEYVCHHLSCGQEEFRGRDDYGPRLSNSFGSSSTTVLTPQQLDEHENSNMPPSRVMIRLILAMVFRKLIRNPNTYSSLLGITWSLVSFRWHLKMPDLIENSISILSDAGLGMAMFSLGLFMALQRRLIVSGPSLAVAAMAIRFVCGPGATAAASAAVGLKGTLLHASIIQAALPQGIVPFVFAKEYNLHPDILSTAVIFGMLVALPVTLLYYILLGL